jgi:hypothetical protein
VRSRPGWPSEQDPTSTIEDKAKARRVNPRRALIAATVVPFSTTARVVAAGAREMAAAQLSISGLGLRVAETGLDEAREPATVFPRVPINVSRPNQWKPERITLIVNGREFVTYGVSERLRKGAPLWQRRITPMNAHEDFVRGLRTRINRRSTMADERVAILISRTRGVREVRRRAPRSLRARGPDLPDVIVALPLDELAIGIDPSARRSTRPNRRVHPSLRRNSRRS